MVPGPAATGLRWLPLARSPRPCFLPLSLCISCPICPACSVGSCPDFESTSTQARFPLSRLPATGTFCATDISHRRAVSFTCLSLPGPRELFEKRDAGRPHLCGSGAWCIARSQRVRNCRVVAGAPMIHFLCGPGPRLSTLDATACCSPLTLGGRDPYFPRSMDEETEAQVQMLLPTPHQGQSWSMARTLAQ